MDFKQGLLEIDYKRTETSVETIIQALIEKSKLPK